MCCILDCWDDSDKKRKLYVFGVQQRIQLYVHRCLVYRESHCMYECPVTFGVDLMYKGQTACPKIMNGYKRNLYAATHY
jgi:hypothetical protein